jgi:hypothetical protein
MGKLMEAQRYHDIADYCLGDARATAELFRRWSRSLDFGKKNA